MILRHSRLRCFSQCFRNFVSLVLEQRGRIIDVVGQFPLRRVEGILQIGQPAERVEDLLQILGQRGVVRAVAGPQAVSRPDLNRLLGEPARRFAPAVAWSRRPIAAFLR